MHQVEYVSFVHIINIFLCVLIDNIIDSWKDISKSSHIYTATLIKAAMKLDAIVKIERF